MKYNLKDFLTEKTIPWMPKPGALPRWQQVLVLVLLTSILTQSISAGLIMTFFFVIFWYISVKENKGR